MKTKRTVLLLAFISGVTALTYQMIWIRKFSLIFGVHIFSVSTVLATFMTGLALGSFLIGKWVDKSNRPVILFMILETGIAVYGLVFQHLLNFIHHIYSGLDFHPSNAYTVSHLVRFALSFFVLIIPTTLMGGTIPVLSKMLVRKVSTLGKNISLLYGSNNIGAFIGCFTTGFILLKFVGLQNGILLAVSLNLINALMAFFMYQKIDRDENTEYPIKEKNSHTHVNPASKKLMIISLVVFALEGFTTLAYEIIWTRILQEFSYEKTIYFNTTIILSFIAGIGIGSVLFKNRADNVKNPYYVLGLLELIIGISSLCMLLLFVMTSPFAHSMRMEASYWPQLALQEYGYYFILLLVPALFMGMTFPLISVIFNDQLVHLGKKMGIIGFLDTIGSVFGTLITGFFILPLLGVANSFFLIVVINVGVGLWLMDLSHKKKKLININPAIFFAVIIIILLFPKKHLFDHRHILYEDETVVAYKEGISANVTVYREQDNQLALAINGAKTAFSNVQDLRVHKMLAYVPAVLTPRRDNALVIGFGMGVTTNELLKTGFNLVEVAELSPEVIQLSRRHFSFLLDKFSESASPTFVLEDGRSYLVRSNKKYDIITSNAVHARLGVNLYTKEFYALCKEKLSEQGAMCQWLPTNWMHKTEFFSLVKAFQEVFPNAQLWYATRGHCLLAGPTGNINLVEAAKKIFAVPEIRQSLATAEIQAPTQLISRLFITDDMEPLTREIPVNSDNRPLVEFSYNIQKQPSIPILSSLKQHTSGFKKYVNDSTFLHKTIIYNKYLVSEINRHIGAYR